MYDIIYVKGSSCCCNSNKQHLDDEEISTAETRVQDDTKNFLWQLDIDPTNHHESVAPPKHKTCIVHTYWDFRHGREVDIHPWMVSQKFAMVVDGTHHVFSLFAERVKSTIV